MLFVNERDRGTTSSSRGAEGGFRMRLALDTVHPWVRKRLLLGLVMALIAIVVGWFLPPRAVVDRATEEWYTQQ